MDHINIMTIDDIDTLKKLRKYKYFQKTKKIIKKNCKFDIKTRSWKDLCTKLQFIKKIINNDFDKFLCNQSNMINFKKDIIKIFSVKSEAQTLNQLKNDFNKFIIFFTIDIFDPYKEFEKSKSKNFKSSSSLEGIDLVGNDNQSLQDIIKKYKVE